MGQEIEQSASNESLNNSTLIDDPIKQEILYCDKSSYNSPSQILEFPKEFKESTQQTLGVKDEGTKCNETSYKSEVQEDKTTYLTRSDSALNIFDQSMILKLFTTKNWTETFFNRIFRKKFLIVSPGEDGMLKLKNNLTFNQQMLQISQNFTEYQTRNLLPAIDSEHDKKLINGLLYLAFSISEAWRMFR